MANKADGYFSSESSEALLNIFANLTELQIVGPNKYTFVLYNLQTKECSKKFNDTVSPSRQGYPAVTSSCLSNSLYGENSSLIDKKYIVLILELNGQIVKNPYKQYLARFSTSHIDKKVLIHINKASNLYLQIASSYGITYLSLDKIVKNAVKNLSKRCSFLGSLTKEDLYSYGWEGVLSAVSQPRFDGVAKKEAYCFSFAAGYMSHALHRKSRMIKCPWEDIKTQKPGTAHLSYSRGNLPEAGAFDPEIDETRELLTSISDLDAKKILKGKPPSPEGALLVNKIKELVNA